jgi:hypothetical protein
VTGIELAYVASESGFSNIFNSPSNGISFQETAGGTNNPSNPPDNLFSNPTILAANGTTTIDYEFVSQVGTFGVGTSEFGIFTTTDPNVVFFGLDDNGSGPNGPGPDDNHDDIIIRATTLSQPIDIPEPATLGLLGAGLAGIGFATRRRRRG